MATPQPVQQQAPVYAPPITQMPMPMPGYSQTAAYPMYPAQAGNIDCLWSHFSGHQRNEVIE